MKSDTTSRHQVNKTVEKLAKICGMLGSSHEGERASAALFATQIITDLDLMWSDIIFAAFSNSSPPPEVKYDDREPGWHVAYCLWIITNKANVLIRWDMDFLVSISNRYASVRLTEKQASVLKRIAIKYGLEI